MQNKWKRHAALLICLCFIFMSLFSIVFIAVEADHNCTGEHCPVCVCIHSAGQTLKQLGSAVMTSAVVVSSLVVVLAALILMLSVLPCSTPVSWKIRMND